MFKFFKHGVDEMISTDKTILDGNTITGFHKIIIQILYLLPES